MKKLLVLMLCSLLFAGNIYAGPPYEIGNIQRTDRDRPGAPQPAPQQTPTSPGQPHN